MSGLYYAGIGSRKTPLDLQKVMHTLAEDLHDRGYVLRSGAAPGADLFFEGGAAFAKEIFLPWKGFNGHNSSLHHVSQEALEIAEKYHPAWDKLNYKVRLLMGRNSYQVLGLDLKTPVKFVACWTPGGTANGGTGQAIRIAKDHGIPVYNLFHKDAVEKIMRQVNIKPLF